ncbi:MAG: methylamine dehydrogenase accessory protein MauD [Candidatus Binatia bacterium]
MTAALLVSTVVLWVVVLVLAGVVVALARQIGVLYERVAPAGALLIGRGPEVGEAAPVVGAEDLRGAALQLGGPSSDGRSTLLFFLSPTCPVCKELLPTVAALARRERAHLRVVLCGDGTRAEHEALLRAQRVEEIPCVLSPALGVAHRVPRLPFAVLLDAGGVIRSKGLVNTREHLESLLEAQERGVASIQDWLSAREGRSEVGES